MVVDPQTKSGAQQPVMPLNAVRDYGLERERGSLLDRIRIWLRWTGLAFSGTKVADWLGIPKNVQQAYIERQGVAKVGGGYKYDPDEIVESFRNPVMNPVIAFHEAMAADGDKSKCTKGNPFSGQKLKVREAWLFTAQVDEHGKMVRDPKIREAIGATWPAPYKIDHVQGDAEYRKSVNKAYREHKTLPKKAKDSRDLRESIIRKAKEDGFLSSDFLDSFGPSDPNQYSEYAPLMGGPFYRQLYMYDFLKQVAYAFEAQNHNPIAKAIIRILTQYSLGRRFDMRIKDPAMKKSWDDFDARHKIIEKVCTFWGKESETYGDFILDTDFWESVDPSTIWDIITDPEHISDEYYYYQSYPTAYQMFTGFKIPEEPGSEKQAASEYIVRQIPASKLLHMKLNCMSNEKRGRSSLFPILGWLKRIKDLYNAQVIREWLYSCFMWDVEIKGNQTDVNNYLAANNDIPLPGSRHVHNESVKMSPLPAIQSTGTKGGSGVGEELLCFIAVACGIPKEFLNIVQNSSGGGSRANALTSAEPFTKMIEDIQARWESFMKDIFVRAMAQYGIQAKRTDVEVLFPSVTKDSTSDTLKNLQLCEMQGWFDNQMCAEMAAKEMNITEFDYVAVQSKRQKLQRAGIGGPQQMAPAGRFGDGQGKDGADPAAHPGGDNSGGSDIHGKGAADLKKELTTL